AARRPRQARPGRVPRSRPWRKHACDAADCGQTGAFRRGANCGRTRVDWAGSLCAAPGKGETAVPLYERGDVRIHYAEAGSGFPLLLIPGGGLNSTLSFFGKGAPFNAFEEFSDEFRCISNDLRNATGGQSSGPLEIERPWDAYADDQLGLMDY